MTHKILISILLFVAVLSGFYGSNAYAQKPSDELGWLPEKGDHFVYDYCGLLSDEDIFVYEELLRDFNDSTSNQIVLMVTPGFGGRDISSFAFDVGNSWGIGQKEYENGVLIVVKPKDETKGEVEIATGGGLEGALPDIFCKRIIEEKMIPHFRENDYVGGISAALEVILPVCAGEYSYEQYQEDNDDTAGALLGLAVVVGSVLWIRHKMKRLQSTYQSGGPHIGGIPFDSGMPYGGNYGGFGSSSSSSTSRSFGGGTFRGGGASGSW